MGIKNTTKIKGLDFELYFVTEVLKLNSLHYGYWKKGWPLTLKNLSKAQEEYTKTLLAMIPKNVKTVLDVGSGIGDNARAMSIKGLNVTALSPDKNHSLYYIQGEGINFHNVKFEEYNRKEKFDLILMSESHTYFEDKTALKKVD